MNKKTTSIISTILGLCIFLVLAYGSAEDENSSAGNQNENSDYTTTSSNEHEYSSNNEKEISTKKQIVSLEKQRQLVKSFIEKIESIEKPSTQSNKNFLEILEYYQQGFATSTDVIQSSKKTKKQCNNAMFSLSDLKVPNNLPNEIESLLKDAKKDLTTSWSIKGTTLNNITGYFKDWNPKRIDYFNNDLTDAQDYTISAFIKISKVYEKLGIIKEFNKPKTNVIDQKSKEKSNNYVTPNNNNIQNESQKKSGTDNIEIKPKPINDTENKTDKQKKREERKRKKEERKKNKNK